jgi:hypothetical protein
MIESRLQAISSRVESPCLQRSLSYSTRTLMDKSYEEKLLGKVDEGVYERKMHDWRQEELRLQAALEAASTSFTATSVLSARRILELAQRAHSIYLSANDTGTVEIAENRTFELLNRWRKSFPFISKAVQPDLRKSEK